MADRIDRLIHETEDPLVRAIAAPQTVLLEASGIRPAAHLARRLRRRCRYLADLFVELRSRSFRRELRHADRA
jgi:hypothetical protein